MAKKRRLSPTELAELKSNFAGLKTITGYASQKAEYAVSAIEAIETEIDRLTERESQLLGDLAEVRDQLAEKCTEFSQGLKGASQQVIGQFGDDSAEIQKLGRVRSSERSTRKPKIA